MPTKQTFRLTLPCEYYLTVDEIWPDGDAPENPTAADVKKAIEDDGGVAAVLRDWDLLTDDDYDVREVTPTVDVPTE